MILSRELSAQSSQCKFINLPNANISKIMLETSKNDNSSYDWAYWEVKNVSSNLDVSNAIKVP